MNGISSDFTSAGVRCAGTLYLPANAPAPPPVVILAGGFAAVRAVGLPAVAERLVAAGFACFLFDYRTFGDSDGEPRHWVSPRRHLVDWRAAIAHVRALPQVDPRHLTLWGTSYSGGHVLALAAEGAPVTAVVAQVPFVSGMDKALQLPPLESLRALAHGLRDVVGSALFGRPHYAPVIGRPHEFAAIHTPDAWDGWFSLLPPGLKWENRVLARAFLTLPFYNPGRAAARIAVPTLVVTGARDQVTRPGPAERAARRIPRGELHTLDCGHFAVYSGACFEESVALQLRFLARHGRG